MPNSLVPTGYKNLLHDLQRLMERGQQAAAHVVNTVRVTTYWKMGQRMAAMKNLANPQHARTLIAQLATDLDLNPVQLYRSYQLYEAWPKGLPDAASGKLSWAHYMELIAIKDTKQRRFYLAHATKETWSRTTLRQAIRRNFFDVATTQPKRGKGQSTLTRGTDPLHVYKAVVEDIIDGDTLLVRIDLGFNVWTSQRLRLRGINADPLTKQSKSTSRAAKAKAFIEHRLKGLAFIVLKTYKTDMYGRYVADVCYHPTIKKKEDVYLKGYFLNGQLLEAGLADAMR